MSDTPTREMDLTTALDVVARWILRYAWEGLCDNGLWERIPEVGEYDLDRIEDLVENDLLPPDVELAEYRKAIEVLAARAEGVEA